MNSLLDIALVVFATYLVVGIIFASLYLEYGSYPGEKLGTRLLFAVLIVFCWGLVEIIRHMD